MRLSPYPKYKASGVEWLGDVPAHWDTKPVSLLKRPGVKTFTDGDWIELPYITSDGIRLLQTGNVGVGEFREQGFRYIDQSAFEELRCTEVMPGDVLICRMAEPVGRACLAPELEGRMITAVDVCILKPADFMDRRYIVYFLSSKVYIDFAESLCRGGTRDRISRSMLGGIRVPIPSLDEQNAVADFLDRETAKIDTLVAKKRTLIERLKEKRAALISRTVTRGLPPAAAHAAGLDPRSKLKASGIDWIGDVPEHWRVAQLRRFTRFVTSGSRGWAEFYADDGAVFIRITNLTRDSVRIDLSDTQHVDPPPGAEGERTRVLSGDVLFSITAYLGSVAVADEAVEGAYINQHIALVRLELCKIEPKFAAYAALADIGQAQLAGQSYGGTKSQLALDDVKSVWLPVPPRGEQRAIVDFLDRETIKLSRMIDKIEAAIERLQEYRGALITAAVTGKVDVSAADLLTTGDD
jgi:type I restriction enzyme S subunit